MGFNVPPRLIKQKPTFVSIPHRDLDGFQLAAMKRTGRIRSVSIPHRDLDGFQQERIEKRVWWYFVSIPHRDLDGFQPSCHFRNTLFFVSIPHRDLDGFQQQRKKKWPKSTSKFQSLIGI